MTAAAYTAAIAAGVATAVVAATRERRAQADIVRRYVTVEDVRRALIQWNL